MNRSLFVIIVLALGGCAAATQPARRTASGAAARAEAARSGFERDAALLTLRERTRELSAQLGLARAEASELRDEVAALREDAARRVVRVTSDASCEDSRAPEEAEAPRDQGPRPVLRLYGTPALPSAQGGTRSRSAARVDGVALPGPDAPAWLEPPPSPSARLPVLASADDPTAGVPAIPATPIDVRAPMAVSPPSGDVASAQYRAALHALSQRRIAEAIIGFERFVEQHPSHPYADNALYWRAEIDYTRREYASAIQRFSRLIARFPRGNKVPGALLRIGLCYERMGQRERARRVFTRLRRQYPNTLAARMASREDA